jgi:hypothetical protein
MNYTEFKIEHLNGATAGRNAMLEYFNSLGV